jgi:transposase-like protein
MLAAALEAEADAYIAELVAALDEGGRRLVTRNGHARPRTITTGSGPIEIQAPRVNDRRVDPDTGEKAKFKSSIVPPWCRKSPKVAELLPLLYLHGLSTGDFAPALTEFFGSSAGLSPSVITRLTSQWQAEHRAFMDRDLSDRDYVYCWVDGVHFNVRLEQDRLCCLVIVGVRLDGTKELVALADGYRESTDSWADLLRDLRRRGMRAPMIAVGDGALGFWAALRDVWPETREQRDWVHKVANTLDALPKSIQPTAKKMLAEIRDAEDRDHAVDAAKRFDAEFRPRWPKTADKIRDDLDRLLTFYDFPAEHWLHLKTSNPIESTFSTVRLRTKVTKGPGSRAAGLAMAFKLIESAQDRWRALNGPHLVALVRAGAIFRKGALVENPTEDQVAA